MHIELPTSSRAHAARACRGTVVALAAAACAALVGACGSSSSKGSAAPKTNVDTARVAASIEGTILEKRHLHATVVCPPPVPAEPGKTFECIATSTSAKPPHATVKTPFVVTIQTAKGYVTYVGR